jgi:hypothetical protein
MICKNESTVDAAVIGNIIRAQIRLIRGDDLILMTAMKVYVP